MRRCVSVSTAVAGAVISVIVVIVTLAPVSLRSTLGRKFPVPAKGGCVCFSWRQGASTWQLRATCLIKEETLLKGSSREVGRGHQDSARAGGWGFSGRDPHLVVDWMWEVRGCRSHPTPISHLGDCRRGGLPSPACTPPHCTPAPSPQPSPCSDRVSQVQPITRLQFWGHSPLPLQPEAPSPILMFSAAP